LYKSSDHDVLFKCGSSCVLYIYTMQCAYRIFGRWGLLSVVDVYEHITLLCKL